MSCKRVKWPVSSGVGAKERYTSKKVNRKHVAEDGMAICNVAQRGSSPNELSDEPERHARRRQIG